MPFLVKFLVVCLVLVSGFFFVNMRSTSPSVVAQNNEPEKYRIEYSYTCRMETRAHDKFIHEMNWPVLGIVVNERDLYAERPFVWQARLWERGVIPLNSDVPAYFTRQGSEMKFHYFERLRWGNYLVTVPYGDWETRSDIVVSPTLFDEHNFTIRGNILDLYVSLVSGQVLVQSCH